MENLFYNEAHEWMQSLNYYVHFYNAEKTSITFQSNNLGAKYPAITCFINKDGEKRCKLSDNVNFKMFLSLNSGDLQFKHPKIEKYIEIFRHYSNLAEQFPPF